MYPVSPYVIVRQSVLEIIVRLEWCLKIYDMNVCADHVKKLKMKQQQQERRRRNINI